MFQEQFVSEAVRKLMAKGSTAKAEAIQEAIQEGELSQRDKVTHRASGPPLAPLRPKPLLQRPRSTQVQIPLTSLMSSHPIRFGTRVYD